MPAQPPDKPSGPASDPPGSLPLASEVDLLVLEYLAHAGYQRSTQALKAELREKREGKQNTWRPVGQGAQDKVKERMLRALDRGDRDEVLRLWENFVPPLVRKSDRNAQKLEFYLNIFFAIFPLHPSNSAPQPSNLAAAMRAFRAYLESDGAALAVTPEFLAYYAMPYVPEISRHPSFKELFTHEWARALKTRLADFLARTPQFAQEPRLLALCRTHRELGAGASHGSSVSVGDVHKDMQALKQRLIDSELRSVEAKREAAAASAVEVEREAALRRGAGEVCVIAADAITALGEPDLAVRLQQRLQGAEDRLGFEPTDFGGRSAGRGGGGGEPPARQQQQQQHQKAGGMGGGGVAADDTLNASTAMLAALDYDAVKRTMVAGGEDAPPLMQALRWRLTKPGRRQRKLALAQYIQNDLLDARVIEAVLSPEASAAVREETLRLINLFASEPAGRTYLLGEPHLIDELCQLLTVGTGAADDDGQDSIARQNCLGALQKLSLRRQPQNAMIDADVIAWLVAQLRDIDSLSQYSVEYGTALLMNLSLRGAGKTKCAEPDLDVLTVLSQLMESDSMQVRTYVNGTLYSILVRGSLKQRADEIGLADSLRALIEHSDETFARQINYILEQIEKEVAEEEEAPSEDEGGDEEEEEEADEEGEADDEEADVFPEARHSLEPVGGISGEPLLASRFLTGVYEAQEEASQLRASMQMGEERRRAAADANASRPNDLSARRRHHPDEPLQRPTTPRASDDYGAHAMAQSGAQPEEGGEYPPAGGVPEGVPEEEGADGEDSNLPAAAYPDPTEVDSSSPTIPVRNRLSRTPHKKFRDDVPPVQPTASRPRAAVERLQRRPPGSTPAKGKPPKGGADGPPADGADQQ